MGPDNSLDTLYSVLADTTVMVVELDRLRSEIYISVNIGTVAKHEEDNC